MKKAKPFSPHGVRGGSGRHGEPGPIERLLEGNVFHCARLREGMYIAGTLSGSTEYVKAGPMKMAKDINAAFAAKQIKATKKRKAPKCASRAGPRRERDSSGPGSTTCPAR